MAFATDLSYSEQMMDRFGVPLLDKAFGRGAWMRLSGRDVVTLDIQRQFGIDLLARDHDGALVGVEFKFMRPPERKGQDHTALYCEVQSNSIKGHETPGWLVKSAAKYLFFGFQRLDGTTTCDIINLPQLREAVLSRASHWQTHYAPTSTQSKNYLVPLSVLRDPMFPVTTFLANWTADGVLQGVKAKLTYINDDIHSRMVAAHMAGQGAVIEPGKTLH